MGKMIVPRRKYERNIEGMLTTWTTRPVACHPRPGNALIPLHSAKRR
jgi:hypothetical protein